MKPPKPRISKRHLVWKWNRTKERWDPYHRVTWGSDGKRKQRTILLKWEGDAQKLDELYWECEAGRHKRQIEPSTYIWAALIREWKSDRRIQSRLSASTKRDYVRTMDAILAKSGSKDVRRTTRAGVRRAHNALADTPRKADKHLQVISILWNFAAKKLDWPLGPNPASGIDKFGKQREYEPWPDWMVSQLDTAPDTVRIAAELILGTGQRPSAAIAMRRDAFEGEYMMVRDDKGDEAFEVYCPERLRKLVAETPVLGSHMLAKNVSEPLTYSAVEWAFRKWRNGLGEKAAPFSLHGLRKLAIITLAEAGATDAQIQAVTNQSAEMVAYYRRRASRKRLSKSAWNKT